jgi:hypothetical protein
MEQLLNTEEQAENFNVETESGLENFLASITEVYETIAETIVDTNQLQEKYDILRTTITSLITRVQGGGEVSDADAETLERLYSEMIDVVPSEDDDSESEEPEVKDQNVAPVSKPATGKLTIQVDGGVKRVRISTPAPVIEIRPVPESVLPPRQIFNEIAPSAKKIRQESPRTTEITTYVTEAQRDPRYRSFVEHAFSSPTDFEVSLLRQIQDIESVDQFERMMGITYSSVFSFLKDMTVEEVKRFDNNPNREVLKQSLQDKNIKYEIYIKWMEHFDYIMHSTVVRPHMTMGELFVRSEIEYLMHHYAQ